MSKKNKSKKTIYAYIDNENVNVSVIKQGWKMDWEKLYNWLQEKKSVDNVKMFMGWHPDYQQMYEFFEAIGYNLIFRKMHTHGNAPLKGNVDTELVLEAMKDFPTYDEAILVSGDGDFACLVNYLREKKKLGGVIVPNKKRYSDFLAEAVGSMKIQSFTHLKKTLSYDPNEPHEYEYGDGDDDEEDDKKDDKKDDQKTKSSKKSSKSNKGSSKSSSKSSSKKSSSKKNSSDSKKSNNNEEGVQYAKPDKVQFLEVDDEEDDEPFWL